MIYEFGLEIQDGTNSYERREFVFARDDRAAARFAREFADNFRPNALHDHELDLYADPAGWPQWRLAFVHHVHFLLMPIVGTQSTARVSLIPTDKKVMEGLKVASRIMETLRRASLSKRTVGWLVTSLLKLDLIDIALASETIAELYRSISQEPTSDVRTIGLTNE